MITEMAGKCMGRKHWARKIKLPWCYSDINMTVLYNHNTTDNTGNVPVSLKSLKLN